MKDNPNGDIYLRELRTILEFSALINSSLKIESVLDNAMKCAEEFINAEASSIYELDDENKELFVRLARGEKKDPIKNIRLKLGEGIAGWVVQSGRPIVVHDVGKEKKFSDKYDKLTGFKTRSLICVPLILRGTTIGAIQVLNKKNEEPFSNADLEILTSMSQQIVVAMENAKLYQRLEKKFELTTQELRSTQKALIRSERLAAMGNLVNGVAHEIRNPITVIGGFIKRIKNLKKNDHDVRKYSDIILSETARLERLVIKVRELSEVQSAELRPAKLETVVDKILERFKSLADGKNIKIILSIDPDLPIINLDSSQMVTALSNLFENALESMRDNGRLELKVNIRDNDSVIITIKDSGAGIPSEKIGSVYDPFVTSKTEGAGLGLTMVYQIVMNHHGEIGITSGEGEGTEVTIVLPSSRTMNA